MDPDSIKLSSIGKMFEYEKQVREIDECRDTNELKQMLKTYIKLYLKQQEAILTVPIPESVVTNVAVAAAPTP